MPEKIEELVRAALAAAQRAGELPEFDVADLGLERPADPANGDWSSTVAMRSAKLARRAPRDIAAAVLAHLPADPSIERVEVAGPGFINFYLATDSANEVFRTVREQGRDFARSDLGAGTHVQVEFVSANPVGPLHVGHGRWAALGDSLCRVMELAGYDVEREYYINDHGSQMDVFGRSVSMRYQQLLEVMAERRCDLDAARAALLADREAFVADEEDERPETHPLTDAFNEALGGNAYGGDYIVDIPAGSCARTATAGRPRPRTSGRRSSASAATSGCSTRFARPATRRAATSTSGSPSAASTSRTRPAPPPLTARSPPWTSSATSTATTRAPSGSAPPTFGDDKDRVLVKTNGDYTYFASDVAYHWNKFQRVDHVIDIWGADHHGYIQPRPSACDALGYPAQFEVLLGQLVNLLRNGKPIAHVQAQGHDGHL